jgi:hypothetical protein
MQEVRKSKQLQSLKIKFFALSPDVLLRVVEKRSNAVNDSQFSSGG